MSTILLTLDSNSIMIRMFILKVNEFSLIRGGNYFSRCLSYQLFQNVSQYEFLHRW